MPGDWDRLFGRPASGRGGNHLANVVVPCRRCGEKFITVVTPKAPIVVYCQGCDEATTLTAEEVRAEIALLMLDRTNEATGILRNLDTDGPAEPDADDDEADR